MNTSALAPEDLQQLIQTRVELAFEAMADPLNTTADLEEAATHITRSIMLICKEHRDTLEGWEP